MSVHYFAYGSNMLAERLLRRCASARFHALAVLAGHRVAFAKRGRDKSGKAMVLRVTENSSACVHGVVYELSRPDLLRLDELEGVGSGYQRIETFVAVPAQPGRFLAVDTYVAEPAYIDHTLVPFDWYLDLIIAGARRNELPQDYSNWLAGHAAIPDHAHDRTTRREALDILARLDKPCA